MPATTTIGDLFAATSWPSMLDPSLQQRGAERVFRSRRCWFRLRPLSPTTIHT